jgi:RNA polymerase sigma-70 factor (ECF subfamily)
MSLTKNSQQPSMSTKPKSLQEMGLAFFESRSERDFTNVYHRLKPSISYYLRELVPNQDDRNEVIATAFAKVWQKIHQYDPYWNFSTWVYRIARNEALLFFRSKKKTYSYDAMQEMGINMEAKGPITESDAFLSDEDHPVDLLYDMAVEEIGNLPDLYKTVLTLREIDKMKYEEIADQLGWKHNTVRTRIRKARELVRTNLLKKDPNLVKLYNQEIS